jgi:hypothetical protein
LKSGVLAVVGVRQIFSARQVVAEAQAAIQDQVIL